MEIIIFGDLENENETSKIFTNIFSKKINENEKLEEMATKFRRRKLQNNINDTVFFNKRRLQLIAPITLNGIRQIPQSSSSSTEIQITYISDLFQIIDNIINRMSFDIIIQGITEIRKVIRDAASALLVIQEIEQKLLGIIENIMNHVPLSIVIDRINYIRAIIMNTPNFTEIYDDINNSIIEIIDMITYNVDLPSVIKSLQNMNIVIQENKMEAIMMENIQNQIISIIDNIINRVPLEIVKDRIVYLIESIKKLIEE